MFKVAPPIYRDSTSTDGWHRYTELVEVVNAIRHEQGLSPYDPLQVLFHYRGMNVHVNDPKKPHENMIRCKLIRYVHVELAHRDDPTIELEERYSYLFLDETTVIGLDVPCERYEIYVPAGWGVRVTQAVLKGGIHSTRIPYVLSNSRVKSIVHCKDGTEYIMK